MEHVETQLLNLGSGVATYLFFTYMNKLRKSQKAGRKKWRPTSHFIMWKVFYRGKAFKKGKNGTMI